jgi:hypothetical protein
MPRELTQPTSIIVVSGLPRSGTSLMMNMLQAGGVELLADNLRGPDIDNPLGYFELDRVKSLPNDSSWLESARGKAVKVISPLLEHLPTCHTYSVLFMQRALDEVLASQAKMLDRRGIVHDPTRTATLRSQFILHLGATQRLLQNAKCFAVHEVSYLQLLRDAASEVDRIRLFLKRDLNEVAMRACVDPSLYRNRNASQVSEIP